MSGVLASEGTVMKVTMKFAGAGFFGEFGARSIPIGLVEHHDIVDLARAI